MVNLGAQQLRQVRKSLQFHFSKMNSISDASQKDDSGICACVFERKTAKSQTQPEFYEAVKRMGKA